MFPGFFVGTVFLCMLVRAVFGGYHRYGYRRGWGWHEAWGPRYAGEPTEWLWGDDPWDAGSRGRSSSERPSRGEDRTAPSGGRIEEAVHQFVRSLRDKLGATAEQERAFAAAIDKLREATGELRGRMNDVRTEIARAIRSDEFDENAFEAASRRVDGGADALRTTLRDALRQIHDVLDPRQREMLARLIETR